MAPIHVLMFATAVVAAATVASDFSSPRGPPHLESQRIYINHEFGFSVEIPFYAPTCDPVDENQQTGFVFFLDAGDTDCGTGMRNRSYVSFHESYNAVPWETVRDYASAMCDHGVLAQTDPKLFGELARWLPLMCRETREEGLERISLYGLAPGAETEYGAFLQTAPHDSEKNRAVFLATLRTLKHLPPDPSDVRGSGWSAILSRELKKEAEQESGN